MGLDDIRRLAEAYNRARLKVAVAATRYAVDKAELVAKHGSDILAAAEEKALAEKALRRAIAAHADYFRQPKTMTLAGTVVGFELGRERVEIADEAATCALIHAHLPGQAGTLIKTTEKPLKATIGKLPEPDRKRIGARTIPAAETVVVRPEADETAKTVDAVVKEIAKQRDAA